MAGIGDDLRNPTFESEDHSAFVDILNRAAAECGTTLRQPEEAPPFHELDVAAEEWARANRLADNFVEKLIRSAAMFRIERAALSRNVRLSEQWFCIVDRRAGIGKSWILAQFVRKCFRELIRNRILFFPCRTLIPATVSWANWPAN